MEMDVEKDPNTLPDCLFKYKLIVKRFKAGKGKFTDTKFKAGPKSMGDPKKVPNDYPWARMSECKKSRKPLFLKGASKHDIKQGFIGDCYLCSALAVLGNRFAKNAFFFVDNEEEWREVGALCVRFY